MRTILLSMQPFGVEQIMSGNKIYEYRKKFTKEEVRAYLYVSKPVQEITGILTLGRRELLSDWRDTYMDDTEVVQRINEYISRNNKYAMPVLSFQRISGIELNNIQKVFPDFIIPQSYYYLDELPLLKYIEKNVVLMGNIEKHDFSIRDKMIFARCMTMWSIVSITRWYTSCFTQECVFQNFVD